MTTIILLSLAGAVISAVIGTFWYSDKTPMGRIHMRYLGMDKLTPEQKQAEIEKAKPTMPKVYGAQFVLSALTSFAVAFIMVMSIRNGVSIWVALGFVAMNWLCFIVPTIGSSILWGNCDRAIAWKKFFSEIACNLVTLMLVGLLASLFA